MSTNCAESKTQPPKKVRIVASDVLKISISSARCTSHLRENIVDSNLSNELKELKTQRKEYQDGVPEELESRIKKLSSRIIRLKKTTPIYVASVLDFAVKDIIRHLMDNTIQNKRKIVDIPFIYSDNLPKLKTYAIWNHLPVLMKYSENTTGFDEVDNSDNNFRTYVTNAFNAVKNSDTKYNQMRISKNIKEYLSLLVKEHIEEIVKLSRELIFGLNTPHTLSPNHIKTVIRMMMVLGHTDQNDQDELLTFADNKLDEFYNFQVSHSADKLDDEEDEDEDDEDK